jgi:hypothetical protein
MRMPNRVEIVIELEIANDFAASHRRQCAIGVGRDRLCKEANAAVAEKEIAAAGVNTVEPGNDVVGPLRRAAIDAAIVERKGGQCEGVVHALIPRRIEAAALGRNAQTGGAKIADRVQRDGCHRSGRPALIDKVGLTGEEILRRRRVWIPAPDAVARRSASAFAHRECRAGPVADIGDLRVRIDVEDAAGAERHLRNLAHGRI